MKTRFNALSSLVLSLGLVLAACSGSSSSTPPPSTPPPSGPAPATGVCSPAECGAASTAASSMCADGSTGGPTGQCLRGADNTCSWEVRECPVAGTPTPAPGASACVRTGCSGTVCAEAGKEVMTTCEMRPEYECYATAACEKQSNGACGFTQTAALTACVSNARK